MKNPRLTQTFGATVLAATWYGIEAFLETRTIPE
jgi:hypothetical protein